MHASLGTWWLFHSLNTHAKPVQCERNAVGRGRNGKCDLQSPLISAQPGQTARSGSTARTDMVDSGCPLCYHQAKPNEQRHLRKAVLDTTRYTGLFLSQCPSTRLTSNRVEVGS